MKTRQVPVLLHSRRDDDSQLGGNGGTTGAYVVKCGEKPRPSKMPMVTPISSGIALNCSSFIMRAASSWRTPPSRRADPVYWASSSVDVPFENRASKRVWGWGPG